MMKPVIQEDITGCGIASSAAIAGISYTEANLVANHIGIYANDSTLWSDSIYVCNLLEKLGIKTSRTETEFTEWQTLPSCALLATKWHLEDDKPFWHWAVYVREDNNEQYVLDSNSSLTTNQRTDFDEIQPKWFIEVNL